MDRKAWQATVHGVARVGHDLATKPPRRDLLKKNWESQGTILCKNAQTKGQIWQGPNRSR